MNGEHVETYEEPILPKQQSIKTANTESDTVRRKIPYLIAPLFDILLSFYEYNAVVSLLIF